MTRHCEPQQNNLHNLGAWAGTETSWPIAVSGGRMIRVNKLLVAQALALSIRIMGYKPEDIVMNESLHDALERIINICNQQLGLRDADTPAECVEALTGMIDKASRAQRVIRAKDANNER